MLRLKFPLSSAICKQGNAGNKQIHAGNAHCGSIFQNISHVASFETNARTQHILQNWFYEKINIRFMIPGCQYEEFFFFLSVKTILRENSCEDRKSKQELSPEMGKYLYDYVDN